MSILSGIKLLGDLSQKDIDNLSLFCQSKKLNKGDFLFKEGEEANSMYILKTGKVEIIKNQGSKIKSLGFLENENFIGEMALFSDNKKRMASVICLEDSELITILSFSIKELASKNPILLQRIKDVINDRIVDNKITDMNYF